MEHETRGTRCPIGDEPTERKFRVNGHWIRECATCGHRFAELATTAAHVAHVYGDDYFFGGGAGYDDYLSEGEILRQRGRDQGRLLNRFAKPGKLLDVGAAAGFLLRGMLDVGWDGRGLEPNAGMARRAGELNGVHVDVGALEDYDPREQFDAICLVQVAAHFYDLRRAFERAAALTRPGGLWLIETWNWRSWTARLLGRRWHEYSPPSVLQWFSPKSLDRLAERYGMQCFMKDRPTKWINGRHAKSLARYKLGRSLFGRLASIPFAFIPDRLPIPYPAEDLFRAVYCKLREHPSAARAGS